MKNRDSRIYLVTLVLAVCVFLGGQFEMIQEAFPGIDPVWDKRIELAAALLAVIAGKLSMSPLPLSRKGKQKMAAKAIEKALDKNERT